jgi:hypothetical protein
MLLYVIELSPLSWKSFRNVDIHDVKDGSVEVSVGEIKLYDIVLPESRDSQEETEL